MSEWHVCCPQAPLLTGHLIVTKWCPPLHVHVFMQIAFVLISVSTVCHKRLFCCAGTTPNIKSTCSLILCYNLLGFFFFDWKVFCVHTNTWIWNTMNTLAIKIVDMVVGTVYNKWGRCVSIKYSLLWYNHTKYEIRKKNPVISWSKT